MSERTEALLGLAVVALIAIGAFASVYSAYQISQPVEYQFNADCIAK